LPSKHQISLQLIVLEIAAKLIIKKVNSYMLFLANFTGPKITIFISKEHGINL
jgi:hypothetical protein